MYKKTFGLILLLFMTAVIWPLTGSSARVEAAKLAAEEQDQYVEWFCYVPEADEMADPEELLEQYLRVSAKEQLAEKEPLKYQAWEAGSSQPEAARENNLTAMEQIVYNAVKKEVQLIAAGKRDNSVIRVSVSLSGGSFNSSNFNNVIYSLLADIPYELYWYDKTEGVSGRISTSFVEMSFTVAAYYRDSEKEGTTYLDTAKTKAASETAARAAAVVSDVKQSASSDREILTAYMEWICQEVSYNNAAASGGVSYGDPWQLIYVFDGDEKTNVVCEGYSKAFKYLCDLTDFRDRGLDCYLMTGDMAYTVPGANGSGGHMWNMVCTGSGFNYLVDVTNCDGSSIGAPDILFMVNAASATYQGGSADEYTISWLKWGRNYTITYQYDANTKSLYTNEERTLELPQTAAVIDSMALTMGDRIDANIYLKVPAEAAKAVITYSYPGWKVPEVQEYVFANMKADDQGRYQLDVINIPAKELVEIMTVEVLNKKNAPMRLMMQTAVGRLDDATTYTVRAADYANIVVVKGNEQQRKQAKALLNYGSMVQRVLNHKTGTLAASAEILAEMATEMNAVQVNHNYDGVLPTGTVKENLGYQSLSLNLEGEIQILLSFSKKVTATMNGKALQVQRNDSSSSYEVVIPHIRAKNMDIIHEVEVSYGTTSFIFQVCALTYANRILATANAPQPYTNLAKAMYIYQQETLNLFGR